MQLENEWITAGELSDIVHSQICLYGDRSVRLSEASEISTTTLWMNSTVLIKCSENSSEDITESSLAYIANVLSNVDVDEPIETAEDKYFELGFETVDGWVEVLNSDELVVR